MVERVSLPDRSSAERRSLSATTSTARQPRRSLARGRDGLQGASPAAEHPGGQALASGGEAAPHVAKTAPAARPVRSAPTPRRSSDAAGRRRPRGLAPKVDAASVLDATEGRRPSSSLRGRVDRGGVRPTGGFRRRGLAAGAVPVPARTIGPDATSSAVTGSATATAIHEGFAGKGIACAACQPCGAATHHPLAWMDESSGGLAATAAVRVSVRHGRARGPGGRARPVRPNPQGAGSRGPRRSRRPAPGAPRRTERSRSAG